MGLDKTAIRQVRQIAKNSNKLSKTMTDLENKIIDKGLELIEKCGIDPNTLPFSLRPLLRGELPNVNPSDLLTPEIICAQPIMSVQQKEGATKLVKSGQEKIEEVYLLTNRIKSVVLTLQEPVMAFQAKAQPVSEQVTLISDVVEIIKLLALPTAAGGIGQPNSVNNKFASTLGTLSDYLKIARSSVALIPAAVSTMTGLLNQVASQVNRVSVLIDPFENLLSMAASVVTLQDQCPLVTQGDIDSVQNNIQNDISGSLSTIDQFENPFSDSLNALEESLKPNAPNPVIYKNFRFVLEYNPEQLYMFPSRRIRCIRRNSIGVSDGIEGSGSPIIVYNNNPTVNPELVEGAYSYASDVRTLIQEAKFAIDVYTQDITLWNPPQFREQVVVSGEVIDIFNPPPTPSQLQDYLARGIIVIGPPPTYTPTLNPTYQQLPSYILYGGRSVNLNNSPTDIEYGADALVNGTSYSGGSGLTISSYIQSGVIQVNEPQTITMYTFGGNGDAYQDGSAGSGSIGFTESLLTIKRSTKLQDDVDPMTGRRNDFGVSGSAAFRETFNNENGRDVIPNFEILYQTAKESTIPIQRFGENEARFQLQEYTFNFLDKLIWLRQNYFFFYQDQLVNGGAGKISGFGRGKRPGPDHTGVGDTFNKPNGIFTVVEILYAKVKPLLYNAETLRISKKMKGDRYRIDEANEYSLAADYIRKGGQGDGVSSKVNMYYAARKAAFGENVGDGESMDDKAATISMFASYLEYVVSTYEDLYLGSASNSEYTSATGLPLIPTSLTESADIEIIQYQQLANRNEALIEEVGTLDVLGTYTYNIEIIDSYPKSGGADQNYPTNFTTFNIEPNNPNSSNTGGIETN